jgi:citrate synthase
MRSATLVENTTFGEVAYLLWEGRLPNRRQFDQLKGDIAALMTLPEHVSKLLADLPTTMQPMDALRTAVSALGALDPT